MRERGMLLLRWEEEEGGRRLGTLVQGASIGTRDLGTTDVEHLIKQ